MRVLLISSNRFKRPVPVIPFGICLIASTLEQAGHTVKVLDLMFISHTRKKIRQDIHEFKPGIIGIGIRNIDDGHAHFFLDEIKQSTIEPCQKEFDGPIVIGGAAVGISGAEMLDFFDLTYAIRGDGEWPMLQFIERFEIGESLYDIKGLMIRKNGKLDEQEPLQCENIFDKLPFTNPHKFLDLRPYLRRGANIQIQTKRGCALNCTYCVYNLLEGERYRYRQPENIADEIEMMHRDVGIDTFEFTDSTFNIPIHHAKEVLRAIKKRDISVTLRTVDLNPGGIDEEFADLLKSSNFKEVGMSVESGSNVILKNLKKNYNRKTVLEAEKILHERNLSLIWIFMIGAPNETLSSIQETFQLIQKVVKRDEVVFISSGIRMYKGSPLSVNMERTGLFSSNDNYFRPVLCQPTEIDVDKINETLRQYTIQHPNVLLMEDSISKTMLLGSVLTNNIKKHLLRIDEPILRTYLLLRKCLHHFGFISMKYRTVRFVRACVEHINK